MKPVTYMLTTRRGRPSAIADVIEVEGKLALLHASDNNVPFGRAGDSPCSFPLPLLADAKQRGVEMVYSFDKPTQRLLETTFETFLTHGSLWNIRPDRFGPRGHLARCHWTKREPFFDTASPKDSEIVDLGRDPYVPEIIAGDPLEVV